MERRRTILVFLGWILQIPRGLIADYDPSEIPVISEWWETLQISAQMDLSSDYSSQAESCVFRCENAPGTWIELPLLVDTSLVETDDAGEDWTWEYWEYQLNHPEDFPIPMIDPPRTFHIGGSILIVALIEIFPGSGHAGRPPHFN